MLGANDLATPVQEEPLPILIKGEPLSSFPKDLYIPPDALAIILEEFSGPLDLLLYLIKQHNLDILDIPIAEVTTQYMEYIELMQSLRLELAADYLVMAATLAEIKSRMLLPRQVSHDAEEGDPRAELVNRLQRYEQFKRAAEDLDSLPRLGRENCLVSVDRPEKTAIKPLPFAEVDDLLLAFKELLNRIEIHQQHEIKRESLSIRERMTTVLERLKTAQFLNFTELCLPKEGRLGVVVTFIAILELAKQSLITIVQTEAYSPIYLRPQFEKVKTELEESVGELDCEYR